MIKLIAAVIMLLDHIGLVLQHSPDIYFPLRLIGRISMPLYAYSVARGYAYSKAHGTTVKYIKNLAIFSAVSQLPYYLLVRDGLNIGFTWLLSVFILINYDALRGPVYSAMRRSGPDKEPGEGKKSFLAKYRVFLLLSPLLAILCFLLVSELLRVDYGASAIVLCFVFYVLEQKQDRSYRSYLFAVLLSCLIHFVIHKGSLLQIFALLGVPVLLWAQECDDFLRLPKWFFYVFYPAHMAVLYAVSQIIY